MDLLDLIDDQPEGSRKAKRLNSALRSYLEGAHKGVTLDQVFGVIGPDGPWHQCEAPAVRRARLVQELAKHTPGSADKKAKQIALKARRYKAARWQKYRDAERDPSADRVDQILDELQRLDRLGVQWPISKSSILKEMGLHLGARDVGD